MTGPGEQSRVRVTSPRTATPVRRRMPTTAGAEIDAQSEIGEIYLRSLLRAQLRVAAGVLLLLALTVGALPLLFVLAPGLFARHVFGMPLTWAVLGFAVYPWVVTLAWLHVRSAERNERAFTQVVERS